MHRASIGKQQTNSKHKAKVTDAIDQEGLHVGEDRGWARIPETDQEIRDQAHCFPTEEQLQHVVRHDQHQHREGKQRNVGEKALIAWIFGHIANRVDVHHQGYRGDNHHHQRGQGINQKANF